MPNNPPLPELFQVSTLMRPLLNIAPAKGRGKRVLVELNLDYEPTDILPPEIWYERVHEVTDAIDKDYPDWVFPSFTDAYSYINKIKCYPVYNAKKIASQQGLRKFEMSENNLISSNSLQMFVNYSNYIDGVPNLSPDWQDFWSANAAYENNPNNFHAAYAWVNSHPMFWRLTGNPLKDFSLSWDTSNGFAQIWHTVTAPIGGKPGEHMFEGGPCSCHTVEFASNIKVCMPQAVSTLDYNLTATGHTYESAVIVFAANIRKHYPSQDMMKWLYGECRHRPASWVN